MSGLERTLGVIATVGAGTVGGVYFAFSTFVMTALRRLPPRQGLVAMQAINRAAPSPLFMIALFGTGALALTLVILGVRSWSAPGALLLVSGGVLYLLSVILTVAFHVPRNDALAVVDSGGAAAVTEWQRYATVWTVANHVRTALALAAAALLILALLRGGTTQTCAGAGEPSPEVEKVEQSWT